MACERNKVNFDYSPTAPRTGETVRFTNRVSEGEEWAWTFGDGSTSTSKNPTHIYKRAGEYTVTLQVDGKNARRCSHVITVYDSVPSFGCTDTTFVVYRDYTYTALVYNPYNYDISYHWEVVGLPAELNADSLRTCTLHFTQAGEATVVLHLTINGEKTDITHTYSVATRPAPSVIMRGAEADYRQYIYESYWAIPVVDATASAVLDLCQDTMQTYNGQLFSVSTLSATVPGIQGLAIADRKLYYRTSDGLYVSMLDGSYTVTICTEPTSTLFIDTAHNRLYWATPSGVYYMPLIGSDNNQFVTTPTHINSLPGIRKIAVD